MGFLSYHVVVTCVRLAVGPSKLMRSIYWSLSYPKDNSTCYSLSLNVIVPSKSVKKMNFGLLFNAGISEVDILFVL